MRLAISRRRKTAGTTQKSSQDEHLRRAAARRCIQHPHGWHESLLGLESPFAVRETQLGRTVPRTDPAADPDPYADLFRVQNDRSIVFGQRIEVFRTAIGKDRFEATRED